DPALAYPFGDRGTGRFQLAACVIGIEGGPQRIGNRDLYARVLELQRQGDAGQRPARPNRASETVDLAFRLSPNFGPGRLEMALAIGNIIELIGPDRARLMFRGKPRGEAPREFHVIVGVGISDRWNLDQF